MILGLIMTGVGVATIRIGLRCAMRRISLLYKYLSKET